MEAELGLGEGTLDAREYKEAVAECINSELVRCTTPRPSLARYGGADDIAACVPRQAARQSAPVPVPAPLPAPVKAPAAAPSPAARKPAAGKAEKDDAEDADDDEEEDASSSDEDRGRRKSGSSGKSTPTPVRSTLPPQPRVASFFSRPRPCPYPARAPAPIRALSPLHTASTAAGQRQGGGQGGAPQDVRPSLRHPQSLVRSAALGSGSGSTAA